MPISLENIKSRSLTVGVVGLGYVGLPLSLAFAEAGVRVMGFDVDKDKVKAIHEGRSYIKHLNHDRVLKSVKSKKLDATTDFAHIATCDAVIICVPTPIDHHLEPDLKYIIGTAHSITPHLKADTLVSLESTTWPGTTEEILLPILEKDGKLKLGQNLYLAFSPEREDPGNKLYNTQTIPKLLGGADSKSLEIAHALYSLIVEKVVPLSSTKSAETAKLFENIFRSVNIALVNELKIICDHMGIDVWEVIQAASTKPFGFMPFWPGPGLGGHCIPVDPFYLTWKAKEFGVHTRFIELAGEINRYMPRYVVEKVQDCLNAFSKPLRGSRILLLGLAYKADVDDMRESPSLELIRRLEQKGASVAYHDPYIPEIGMTREYPELAARKSQEITSGYDCFLLATAHTSFSKDQILALQIPIIDTRNFFPKSELIYPA